MTEISHFNYHGDGVRIALDEHGDPWFVLADLCKILGLVQPAAVARRLSEDEKGMRLTHTLGGQQQMLHVSESGMWTVILRSDSPAAEPVRRWVTGEVLPSIRKSGSYGTPQLTGRELMAHALVEAQSVIEAAEKRVKELEPSAHSWDTLVADTAGDWSMRDAAQILARDPEIQIGQNRLAKWLRQIRWIDSRGIPYQPQIDNGRLMSKPQTRISHRTGERVACDPQVRITLKGLSWLHQHLGGVAELQTDAPMLAAVGS